tara:strand:- start:906 stop:1055 length:150 start_codon:yes stop_codon:yes gene_type:complete
MLEICPKCKCNIKEEIKQKEKNNLDFRIQRIEAMRRLAIIKLDKKNNKR